MKLESLFVAVILSIALFSSAGFASAQTLPPAWCHTFNVYLQLGDTDASKNGEITQLQTALTKNGFNASADSPGIFGIAMQNAVRSFQIKYKIASGPSTPGYGKVGPKTRVQLNALCGCITDRDDVAGQILNIQNASVDYYAVNTGAGYSDFCENKTFDIAGAIKNDNYSFACNDKINKSTVCNSSQWAVVACDNNDGTDCFCTDASGLANSGSSDSLNFSVASNCDCSHAPAPVAPTAPVLVGISIINSANKLVYSIGDYLNIDGLQAVGYYSDGTFQEIPIDGGDISGFDSSVAGKEILTVNYDGQTTAYGIIISATSAPVVPATGITLSEHSTLLKAVGSTYRLYYSITPASATENVTWSSDTPSVLTVDNAGFIKAVATGTATITATVGALTDEDIVTVGQVSTVPVTGIFFNPSSVSVSAGSTIQLVPVIAPTTATNQNVTWVSGNTSVATVSNAGFVKAIAPGTAIITATASDATSGTFSAAVTVKVNSAVSIAGITINPSYIFPAPGVTTRLYATPIPADSNATITYSSSAPSVVTVDNTGLVTAISNGTAKITATAGTFKATATVVVASLGSGGGNVATYKVIYTAGANGSISGARQQTVSQGSNSPGVTAVANSGYQFVNWSDGSTSNPRTDVNVKNNISVTANFAVIPSSGTFDIGISLGTYCGVSVVGGYTVNAGANKTITLSSVQGYQVSNVTVDGVSQGAITSYTFYNVTADHTLSVVCVPLAQATYTMTATAGSNGTITFVVGQGTFITAGTNTVNSGAYVVYHITPNAGYAVSGVSVDGVAQGAITQYSFNNVSANHAISATFVSTSTPSSNNDQAVESQLNSLQTVLSGILATANPKTLYGTFAPKGGPYSNSSVNSIVASINGLGYSVIADDGDEGNKFGAQCWGGSYVNTKNYFILACNTGDPTDCVCTDASGVITVGTNSQFASVLSGYCGCMQVTVNGSCGSANGTTSISAPSNNLCSAGTATSVSGSGPWTWTCSGSNGGTSASCSANASGSCMTASNPGSCNSVYGFSFSCYGSISSMATCSNFSSDSTDCSSMLGCSWDGSQCSGVLSGSCSNITGANAQTLCGQQGCNSSCNPIDNCGSITDQSSCSSKPDCTWVGSMGFKYSQSSLASISGALKAIEQELLKLLHAR